MGFTAYRNGKDNEEVKRKDSFHLFPEQLCLMFPHVLTIFVMIKLMPLGNCAHMKFGNFSMVWYLILNYMCIQDFWVLFKDMEQEKIFSFIYLKINLPLY